jgi:hypothetical protein
MHSDLPTDLRIALRGTRGHKIGVRIALGADTPPRRDPHPADGRPGARRGLRGIPWRIDAR